MFICDECHPHSGCQLAGVEPRSFGNCEVCGFTASCADCHQYDFRAASAAGWKPRVPATEDAELA